MGIISNNLKVSKMTLYLRERRRCKTCEYRMKKSDYDDTNCHFNTPKIFGDRGFTKFPTVQDDDFCSHWEPKWHENQQIKEAWNEFIIVHKLITSGEEDEKT